MPDTSPEIQSGEIDIGVYRIDLRLSDIRRQAIEHIASVKLAPPTSDKIKLPGPRPIYNWSGPCPGRHFNLDKIG
jgi:hypothetical protein